MEMCSHYEYIMPVEEQEKLIVPINLQRTAQSLNPVQLRSDLTCVAQKGATLTFSLQKCGHDEFPQRITTCQATTDGEVAACGAPNEKIAVRALMKSPPHKRIIMAKDAKHVGVGRDGFKDGKLGWYFYVFD